MRLIITDLQILCGKVTRSREIAHTHPSVAMRPAKDPLVQIAQGCQSTVSEMLSVLEALKAKDPQSKRSVFKATVKLSSHQVRGHLSGQSTAFFAGKTNARITRLSYGFLAANHCQAQPRAIYLIGFPPSDRVENIAARNMVYAMPRYNVVASVQIRSSFRPLSTI
jgi:hypothetical protein